MKGSSGAPDKPSADDVVFTSDILMALNKKLGYPGGYVREIPLD